jgi:hypothetical protein
MWVIRKHNGSPDTYDIGYYTPDSVWILIDGPMPIHTAMEKVHWLNGGN